MTFRINFRKVAKTVSHCWTKLVPRRKRDPTSSKSYVLASSPSPDTPYPTPSYTGTGPPFLSAVGLVAYLRSPPHSQSTRQSSNHDLAPNPQPTPVVTAVPYPLPSIQGPCDPSPLPSSVVPLRGPGDIHILTAEELNAAIDRMLERLDAQEARDEGCFVISPVKQPTKPVVRVVQPRPSPSAAATICSSSFPISV